MRLQYVLWSGLLLWLAASARAEVDLVCKIRSSGGDYTNLSTWEAAIESDLTAAGSMVFAVQDPGGYVPAQDDGTNVTFNGGATGILKHINTAGKAYIVSVSGTVTPGTVTIGGLSHQFEISDTGQRIGLAVAECYNDWSGEGLHDNVTVQGWTTDASHYVKIYAPAGQRHQGKAGTGFRMWYDLVDWQAVLHVRANYAVVEGVEVSRNHGSWGGHGIKAEASSVTIDHCLVRNVRNNGITLPAGGNSRVGNTLVYGCGAYGLQMHSHNVILYQYVYNCTIVSNGTGLVFTHNSGNGGRYSVRNVLLHKNGTDFRPLNFDPAYTTVRYTASSDATADDLGGEGNRINQAFFFKDEAADDFHLSLFDKGAKDWGTNLVSDAFYPLADDLDFEKRKLPWDIGADDVPPPRGLIVTIR